MARKTRFKFNIDKLKLCLNTPEDLFVELTQQVAGYPILYDNFFLFIINDGRGKKGDKTPIKIVADLYINEEDEQGKNIKLGTFTFNAAKYEGHSFFEFDNRSLYRQTSLGYTYVGYLAYVLDSMNIEINNITQVDISADSTTNVRKRVLDLIKNTNYTMIYKGKVVLDDEELEDFGEYFTRKRAKRNKIPTLYFSHKKEDGLAMKIYNKSKEILKSGKDYINDTNDFGKQQTITRTEITIKNEEWKKVISKMEGKMTSEAHESLTHYSLPMIEDIVEAAFAYTSEKLLYFRSSLCEKITLLDIIKGEA